MSFAILASMPKVQSVKPDKTGLSDVWGVRAEDGAVATWRFMGRGILIRGFLKGIGACALACALVVAGVNTWVVLSSKGSMESLDEAVYSSSEPCDCIIVLGASVYADGTLSPILQSRVDAAIQLYKRGVAPVIVMSGDGREANYNEPSAMKEYAVSCGVSEDDVFCDPGGYNTYDTMWRVSRVFGADSCFVVTQEYHLYRAVFDAQGVGMDARGIVSDEGTYNDQLWYDIREIAGRTHDFWNVAIGAVPDNPGAAISL